MSYKITDALAWSLIILLVLLVSGKVEASPDVLSTDTKIVRVYKNINTLKAQQQMREWK